MDRLVLHPTSTSQWHALVNEASNACQINLNEELQSYLVFLLMRFVEAPDIAKTVLALELLNSAHQQGHHKIDTLREVGDSCLLFSGLFPGRARKRRVRISYYVSMGQTAYSSLSEQSQHNSLAPLFSSLCEQFVPLMDILHSMRELDNQGSSLDALQAEEVWTDTGSSHALQTLQKFTNAHPILNRDTLSQLKH